MDLNEIDYKRNRGCAHQVASGAVRGNPLAVRYFIGARVIGRFRVFGRLIVGMRIRRAAQIVSDDRIGIDAVDLMQR